MFIYFDAWCSFFFLKYKSINALLSNYFTAGKVEINQNEEKIDEDLRITKARLNQNRQAATNLRQLQENVATNHDDQVLQKETSLKKTVSYFSFLIKKIFTFR